MRWRDPRFRDPVAPTALAVALLVAFLAVYPTAMLFYGSFTTAELGQSGELTLANYAAAYGDPQTYRLLADSFVFAAGAALGSLVFAVALAWITVRTNAPLRGLFELVAIVPNVFPPALLAIAWTLLASPSVGLLNALLKDIFHLQQGPLNIYSMPGLIFVEALVLTPLAFLIVAAALRGMDPSLEESARMLGSSQWRILRRITLPLMRPAVLAALTLNFVRALESFDTPAIIALPARIEVFTTKIYREALQRPLDHVQCAALIGLGKINTPEAAAIIFTKLHSGNQTVRITAGKVWTAMAK